jgi:hypothetical protein
MKACGIALLALLLPAASLAKTVKVAVVIGNNRGHDPARTLRFAERDARKIRGVLTELGGFKPDNVMLLQAQTARQVWAALRRAEERVKQLGRQPGVRSLLVIYYSGHADGDVIELGSTTLSYDRLTRFLRSSSADVRLAFVDSCRSGKLVASKGGRRGRAYPIKAIDEIASRGFALITSSSEDELSQESAEVRGSYFTHYLVSALRGAGDASGDGNVTLDEAYWYTYRHTVGRTSKSIEGPQHPMYDFKLSGRGAIVLTSTQRGKTTLTVTSRHGGRVVVLDSQAESSVAEGDLSAGEPTRLALAPGAYHVYLLDDGSARRAWVVLGEGMNVRLADPDFVKHSLERGVAKGGLFRRRWGHQLGAGFVLRRHFEQGAAMGAAVQYVLQPRPSWQILGRLSWTSAPDSGQSTGYFDLGARVGPFYRLRYSTGALRVGAVVGYDHMFQDKLDGQARNSSAFVYHGALGVEVPMGQFLITIDGGVGGRVFRELSPGGTAHTSHSLDVSMLLGAGWKWGSDD